MRKEQDAVGLMSEMRQTQLLMCPRRCYMLCSIVPDNIYQVLLTIQELMKKQKLPTNYITVL